MNTDSIFTQIIIQITLLILSIVLPITTFKVLNRVFVPHPKSNLLYSLHFVIDIEKSCQTITQFRQNK